VSLALDLPASILGPQACTHPFVCRERGALEDSICRDAADAANLCRSRAGFRADALAVTAEHVRTDGAIIVGRLVGELVKGVVGGNKVGQPHAWGAKSNAVSDSTSAAPAGNMISSFEYDRT